MAKLTDDEARMLKQLSDKQKAPDGPGIGRNLSISIDLGDDKQIARAKKLGLFPDDFEAEESEVDPDADPDADEPPKRGGYFK